MENPHAERQAVLLERIVKNAVSQRYTTPENDDNLILRLSGQVHGTHS